MSNRLGLSKAIGRQWLTLLDLKLEAGYEPIDTYTRVLTGISLDEESMLGVTDLADGHDKQAAFNSTILMRYETTRMLDDEERPLTKYRPAYQHLWLHFAEFMAKRGPKTPNGTSREPMGHATIKATWDCIVEAVSENVERFWDTDDDYPVETHRAMRLYGEGTANPGHPRPVTFADNTKPRFVGLADLARRDKPEPLIEGLLGANKVTLLLGQFSTYKSFTLIGWSVALASGTDWCGHKVPAGRPVMYVAAEGRDGLLERAVAYCVANGIPQPANLFFYDRPLKLANPEDVADLQAVVEETGAKLVVLDTWHKVTTGLDESGATGMGVAMSAVEGIREATGAAFAIAHHTGYDQAHARGSSSLEDDSDMVWLIELKGGQNGSAKERILNQRKNRDGELVAARQLVFDKVGVSGYVRLEQQQEWTTGRVNAVLDELDAPADISERSADKELAEAGYEIPMRRIRAALRIRQQ